MYAMAHRTGQIFSVCKDNCQKFGSYGDLLPTLGLETRCKRPTVTVPGHDIHVMGSQVPVYVHAIVKDSDYNDFGISARSIEYYMAALTKFFVFWLYVIGIFANLGLACKQLKSIIKLFQ